MILQFSLSNYLSFQELATLSMVKSALRDTQPAESDVSFIVEGTNLKLLRSSIIFGANASGKSNIIKAFDFYKQLVIGSFKDMQSEDPIAVEPFRLNASSLDKPTMMEMLFVIDSNIYRHGFEITQTGVCKEWLYVRSCRPRAKEVELFYREGKKNNIHSKYSQALEIVNKKMLRNNALLLSTLAQFNDPTAISIIHWLNKTKTIIDKASDVLWQDTIKHLENPELRKRIVAFSKYADLGIDNIEKINDQLMSVHPQYDNSGMKRGNVSFSFEENESEGTMKYLSLAYPILKALDEGRRLIIDELGAKLHPLLVEHIVSLFNSEETNPKNAQLIFSTHDTNLLTTNLFRRDQVWFTEMDYYGASQLFSLAEYKVRSTAAFERNYLQGKYGATPIIGNPYDLLKK